MSLFTFLINIYFRNSHFIVQAIEIFFKILKTTVEIFMSNTDILCPTQQSYVHGIY